MKLDHGMASILELPQGPDRTAALAAWLQSVTSPGFQRPILVGGAAVELYTGGAYTTGDLDFVGTASPLAVEALQAAGFERVGRHWLHEEGQVFFEFPGSDLEPPADPVDLVFAGRRVTMVPIESLLADRLAAWKFWRSGVDAVNALLLIQNVSYPVGLEAARRLSRALEVEDELERLLRWKDLLAGRRPSAREIEDWLGAGMRTP